MTTDLRERLEAKQERLARIFGEAGPTLDMRKVTSLGGTSEQKVEAIRKLHAEITDLGSQALLRSGNVFRDEDAERPSIGEAFVRSQAFRRYDPGRPGPEVTLQNIDIKNTLFETGAGWEPEATRSGVVAGKPTRPAVHVVDFIPTIPTTSDPVEYMEETTQTGNATEKAEGATAGEAELVLVERTRPVERIPVWLPVADRVLEDDEAAAAYIDSRLGALLRQRLDLQVLVGDGSTPNLLGTENVTGIQSQALGADPIPDAIFKAMRKVRDDGFAEPTVVFITPTKWQDVRLLRTSDGIYIFGPPSQPGPESIWGVPVVQTTAAPSTKALLGDYATHSHLYVRRDVTIQISNAHDDSFIKGKTAVRATMRVAMVHYRASAFAEVTGL